MIKRILTPLDPSPFTEAALDYASFIAARQQAEITGLAILDIPGIEKSIGPEGVGGVYWAEKLEEHKRKEAEATIAKLLQHFRQKCEKAGVAHSEADLQGSPSEQIIADSIYYDLITIGMRTFFHFETQQKPGDSLEKILDHTITPILAVPDHFIPIQKVLIAFDGSLPAGRSLQRFAHLAIARDLDVKLLMSSKNKQVAEYHLVRAAAYLRAYGIQKLSWEISQKSILDLMAQQYLDWADLVVAGAHSKRGILDFMVGSLIKYLIDEARKPLFIGF